MDFFGNILGQGKNANPSIQQGTSQFEAGNYGEAVKSFEKALKIEPENGFSRLYMGRALACLGRGGGSPGERTEKDKAGLQAKQQIVWPPFL